MSAINYMQYATTGKALIEQLNAEAAAKAAKQEAHRLAENRALWMAHLERSLAVMPEELGALVTFDCETSPYSSSSYEYRRAFLNVVPNAPIAVCYYDGRPAFIAQRAHRLDTDFDEGFLSYMDGTPYQDVTMAIAEAVSFGAHNEAMEEELALYSASQADSEPEPATEPAPVKRTSLDKARAAIGDDCSSAAMQLLMLSIAESLEVIANGIHNIKRHGISTHQDY